MKRRASQDASAKKQKTEESSPDAPMTVERFEKLCKREEETRYWHDPKHGKKETDRLKIKEENSKLVEVINKTPVYRVYAVRGDGTFFQVVTTFDKQRAKEVVCMIDNPMDDKTWEKYKPLMCESGAGCFSRPHLIEDLKRPVKQPDKSICVTITKSHKDGPETRHFIMYEEKYEEVHECLKKYKTAHDFVYFITPDQEYDCMVPVENIEAFDKKVGNFFQ